MTQPPPSGLVVLTCSTCALPVLFTGTQDAQENGWQTGDALATKCPDCRPWTTSIGAMRASHSMPTADRAELEQFEISLIVQATVRSRRGLLPKDIDPVALETKTRRYIYQTTPSPGCMTLVGRAFDAAVAIDSSFAAALNVYYAVLDGGIVDDGEPERLPWWVYDFFFGKNRRTIVFCHSCFPLERQDRCGTARSFPELLPHRNYSDPDQVTRLHRETDTAKLLAYTSARACHRCSVQMKALKT